LQVQAEAVHAEVGDAGQVHPQPGRRMVGPAAVQQLAGQVGPADERPVLKLVVVPHAGLDDGVELRARQAEGHHRGHAAVEDVGLKEHGEKPRRRVAGLALRQAELLAQHPENAVGSVQSW
jgi:hypothetical protein